MSTLSLEGCTYAVSRADFEPQQLWTDTPQHRSLLAAYEAACQKSSRYAVGALKAERAGWPDAPMCKAKAAHWETVADTLRAVLSMEIDEGKEEILLPDPWE